MNIIKGIFLLAIISINFEVFATDPQIKDRIHKSIENFAKHHRIQAVYGISLDGKMILSGAQGFSDFEENKRLSIKEMMPIISATKQFTAAGILLLQERNLLSVNDTIEKLLPLKSGIWPDNKLPDWASKIKVHDLLTHSSGLPEYIEKVAITEATSEIEANQKIFEFFANEKPQFTPGSKYSYNNTGYVILGVIIEKISGQKLADFFKKEFFDPLHMKNTMFLSLSESIKLQKNLLIDKYPVSYYAIPSHTTPKFTAVVMDRILPPNGDGGIVSNVEDLIKWNEALHHGKILSKSSYDLMIKPYFKMEDKKNRSYTGYGIFSDKLDNGKIYYHHGAADFGRRCDIGYLPDYDISIAMMSNVMLMASPTMKKDKKTNYLNNPENQIDIKFLREAIFKSL